MKIKGTAAIVTGAASGMGAETAKYLSEAGAKVTLLDLNYEAAEAFANKISATAIACDVTDPNAVKNALDAAKEQNGPARICVNCAGIAPAARIVGREGPLDLDAFSQVININLIGSFNVMRLFANDAMKTDALNDDGERGVIINTASVAAFDGQIGQAAYSASKGGIVSMTLPAAREFAKWGIRVMTIAPGIIRTQMMMQMPQEVQDSLAAQIPFPHRLGKPSEYAKLALHIVENPLLNGEVIRLDGAIRMQAK